MNELHYTVISKPSCGFCDKAKSLLRAQGIAYHEIEVDVGQTKRADGVYMTVAELKESMPEARSVPIILQGSTKIGGYPELVKHLS